MVESIVIVLNNHIKQHNKHCILTSVNTSCFHYNSITVTHSPLNHNENMPYPAWKSCRTRFRNLFNVAGETKRNIH